MNYQPSGKNKRGGRRGMLMSRERKLQEAAWKTGGGEATARELWDVRRNVKGTF